MRFFHFSGEIMEKILVIRNDKLGDFMQAWPAFAMLKLSNPSLKLTALYILRTISYR